MTATPLAKLPDLALTPVAAEVLSGLTAQPKTLSPWLFYDREGSRLFEAITRLPEYYLTRTERDILSENAAAIVAEAADGQRLTIFELGAGTATKTGHLLKAAIRMQSHVTYHALDVSQSALAEAKARLESELPGVTVKPHVVDYTSELGVIAAEARSRAGNGVLRIGAPLEFRQLVLYIGSSIGNFAPEDALALLRGVRAQLKPGDSLLLGVDMVKEERFLLDAYNDAAGVTAKFNRNVLTRINRELDASFDPQLFRHKAIWNREQSRVEMHLESVQAQQIPIRGLDLEVNFAAGETIHTENSHKFTQERALDLLQQAGFNLARRWTDARGWFSVYLAKAS